MAPESVLHAHIETCQLCGLGPAVRFIVYVQLMLVCVCGGGGGGGGG